MNRKHPDAECEICPLQSKPCARTVHPKRLPAKAAIVSRSPGAHEARTGEPFTGESGKVLNHLLNTNGVSRDEVLLTNVVLCAPDAGKVPLEAVKACNPRLRRELEGYDLVVACGREAVNLLVGSGAIDRYRGYRIQENGRTVVAANNPALVLHDDSTFPDLKRDFARAFNPLPDPILPEVEIIEGVEDAIRYLKGRLQEVHPITAVDIESRGGITHNATLISIQFSTHETSAVVLGERGGIFTDRNLIDNYLRPYLESKVHRFVWHNGKFDTKILRHSYGIQARVDEDTMLLSYALDERSGTDERVGVHGLDYLLMDTFGWPYYSSPAVEQAKKTGEVTDYDEFYRYAGLDVGGTFQLFHELIARAERDGSREPYYSVLLPANEFLTDVELNGMVYDIGTAADLHEFEVQPELDELVTSMQKSADNPLLNPASPKQMAHLIYDVWGIRHGLQSRPDMARSVDESARTEIIEGRFRFRGNYTNERVGNIVRQVRSDSADEREAFYRSFVGEYDRYQKLAKQSNTYLVGMIKRAEADEDSRIYTQLNLHGTNSGRLSSSKPNLQNITRSKTGLPDIRRLFRASSGRQIVQADFSQAELRCIAQFSGDKELTRIYREGLSLHKETATRFYGSDYTGEQYSTCKNVNFGVFYRQTADTFQEKHGIPKHLAEPYIAWVWETFTGVKEWEDEVEKEIRSRHLLVSPFGRRRRFHLLTRENLQAAYREGINFYPQSTASDLTLCAGIRLGAEIDRSKASIGILVHDSIVSDVQEEYVEEYSTIVTQIMAGIAKDTLGWDLPFAAEVGIGPDWGSCK